MSLRNSNQETAKADRDENYKSVNLTCVLDKRLSWKAKGIHAYLITRSEDWKIYKSDLIKRSSDGARSFYSGVNELIKLGYVFRIIKRNKKRQIEEWGYYSLEKPNTLKYVKGKLKDSNWEIYTKNMLSSDEENSEKLDVQNVHVPTDPDSNNRYLVNNKGSSSLVPKEESSFLDSKETESRKEDSVSSKRVTPICSSSEQKVKLNRRPLSRSQIIRNKAKQVIHPLPKPPNAAVTPPVQDILEHWRELKLFESKETTKTYRNGIKKIKGLLTGKLFGTEYTVDDIKQSITNFSFAALDDNFEPTGPYKKNLQKTNIDAFILSEHSTNGDKSKFQKYLDKMPQEAKEKTLIQDDSPSFTSELKSIYTNAILGGIKLKFPIKDENCFRKAAIKFNEFCEDNYEKIRGHIDEIDGAKYLFDSIEKDRNGDVKGITPGWFCSNETWVRRFPAYLNFQGLLLNGNSSDFNMYSWRSEDDVNIDLSDRE